MKSVICLLLQFNYIWGMHVHVCQLLEPIWLLSVVLSCSRYKTVINWNHQHLLKRPGDNRLELKLVWMAASMLEVYWCCPHAIGEQGLKCDFILTKYLHLGGISSSNSSLSLSLSHLGTELLPVAKPSFTFLASPTNFPTMEEVVQHHCLQADRRGCQKTHVQYLY